MSNISILTKGGSENIEKIKWIKHRARINKWFNDYIYILKKHDISEYASHDVSSRNKNRFGIILNDDKFSKTLETVFKFIKPPITPNAEKRAGVLGHLVDILIGILDEIDQEVLDLIEGHIVLVHEALLDLMLESQTNDTSPKQKSKVRNFSCLRDIPLSAMKEETKETLLAIRTIFDSVLNNIMIKYRDIIKMEKKEVDTNIITQHLQEDWDKNALINIFAPLKAELSKYHPTTEEVHINGNDTERKLREEVSQLKKTLLEHQHRLKDKDKEEEQEKKKQAEYLQSVLSANNATNPLITTQSIYQQLNELNKVNTNTSTSSITNILMQNKNENDTKSLTSSTNTITNHEINMGKKNANNNTEWVKDRLPMIHQHAISNSLNDLASQIKRINDSNTINTEHIVKIIQCGMFFRVQGGDKSK